MENDCFIRYKDGRCFKGRDAGIGWEFYDPDFVQPDGPTKTFASHRYIDPMCLLSLISSDNSFYQGQNIDYIETPLVKIIFKKQYKDEKDD